MLKNIIEYSNLEIAPYFHIPTLDSPALLAKVNS